MCRSGPRAVAYSIKIARRGGRVVLVGVAGRRGSHLLLRDEVEFVHPGQDRVSLANGFFKVVKRRKAIRASDEAGEHAPETEVSFRPSRFSVGN